jgi:hypothetical protein
VKQFCQLHWLLHADADANADGQVKVLVFAIPC